MPLGSEAGLRETFRERLKPFGRIVRMESAIGGGLPDEYYTLRRPAPYHAQRASGWVELKYLADWPARPTTPVRIPSLTQEQATWLAEEARAGGRASLLLQVGDEYLFFQGSTVEELFLRAPRPKAELLRSATCCPNFNIADVLRFLAG